jgi:5-methylcytosine-specific restriction endonuclease McrA
MDLYYAKNKEACQAVRKQYRESHREEACARTKAWREKHPGYSSAYMHSPITRPSYLAQKKAYRLANPGRFAAYTAKRKAQKLHATPKWLSTSQLSEIMGMYQTAQELSWLSDGGLEVDHIVPLQGIDVCGLHVPWNLRIIPRSDNRSKSNKLA